MIIHGLGHQLDDARYGRFGILRTFWGYEIHAWRTDISRWDYTGIRCWRSIQAHRIAQAMMLAEFEHWGPDPNIAYTGAVT